MAQLPVSVISDPKDDEALQAWVEVTVGGSAVRMLVDTGSRGSAIPASAAVGAASDTVSTGHGVSGNAGQVTSQVVTRLALPDGYSCDGLTVEVQPADWPHPPHLGRDVFDGHVCDFRLAEGVVEIDPTETPTSLQPFEPWRGGPRAAVRWGDTVVDAVWDTGAGITLVDRSWAEDHPEAVEITDEPVWGTDVTGTDVSGVHGRITSYAIADLVFPEQACVVVDLSALNAQLSEPIRFILGLPQIVQSNWRLDFRTQVLGIYSVIARPR